ncbi:protein kinase-like domain, concanavalin A-like lectin/glucanase domain protein [Tanacetum coccineum]
MENANPLNPSPISKLFYLKKKNKFELWFENDESDESLAYSEEEFEEEEEDDLEYIDTFPTKEELKYHEWLLKNPQPSWIMNEGLKSREKPSNPRKTCNFVGRVRGIKVFVENFTYECDFMVLEDVSSVIDHYLGEIVLGKPIVKQSKLTYDKEEGTVMFKKNNKRVTFKMPHKMERFKDIEYLNTDNIPLFFVASKGDEEKRDGYVNRKRMTHYSKCFKLGSEYKRDEGMIKTIKFLNGRSNVSERGVT